MKVGIVSDSHDHLSNLIAACQLLKEAEVEAVIHCGDFCAPFVLEELHGLGVPVHGVFGNVDGDPFRMERLARTRFTNVELHGELAELDLGGRSFAVTHYPTIADGLARSGKYDVVCYGHTHDAETHRQGSCLVVNPGEIMGRKGTPGFATLDTEALEVEFHVV